MPHLAPILAPAHATGSTVRALLDRRVLGWLMVLVLVIHGLLLPRLAMLPRALVGRETEHEERVEVAWRGGASDEREVRPDRRMRRFVSHFARLAARRPAADDSGVQHRAASPRTRSGDLVHRNGTGGPLRC
jgi:hypothetical protein